MVASENPDYLVITLWLGQALKKRASFAALSDSRGRSMVILEMKFSAGMCLMIAQAGEKSKELTHHVLYKLDEAMKKGDMLKGRQIVFLFLDNFKTFDNSGHCM
jgi:hypothetical protein